MIIHRKEFEYYCSGKTLKEVADRFNKTINTVKQWSSREKWAQRKREEEKTDHDFAAEQKKHIQECLFEQLGEKAKKTSDIFMQAVLLTVHMCTQALQEIYTEGSKDEGVYRRKMPEIRKILKALADAAHIQRFVLPELPKEMAEAMLREVIELRQEGTLEEIETNIIGLG